ncbi:MAG: FAD-binding oxidoreductase [Kiritimatiellae bacterium]|nr:FAD-binding oxidoreductase [Kiritimatiellia bacterium]
MKRKTANWGNYPTIEADVLTLRNQRQANEFIHRDGPMIARGLGRCYGDSALSETILSTESCNNLLAFDSEKGILTCEAGVSLANILDVFTPRGWFLPVTPGTKFVTIGGAIAADVHGKSSGSFCDYVLSMQVMKADGEILTCSKTENAEFFETTRGGMGLTGLILQATIQLIPVETAYIREETVQCKDLDSVMDLFDHMGKWTYSVAWIDCVATGKNMGRSVMMRGEHARRADLVNSTQRRDPLNFHGLPKLDVPIMFPNFALNNLSVKAFNMAYYHKCPKGAHEHIVNYDAFFYPLDFVNNWNRIYGRRGFTQYQFLLPMESSYEGLPVLLEKISSCGLGSFLAVLKKFGPHESFISFPKPGYFLALDFPITKKLFALLDEFDKLVLKYGGRLYLAKDVRMKPEMFFKGYENADTFCERIKQWDPQQKFQSLQSRRLNIHQ